MQLNPSFSDLQIPERGGDNSPHSSHAYTAAVLCTKPLRVPSIHARAKLRHRWTSITMAHRGFPSLVVSFIHDSLGPKWSSSSSRMLFAGFGIQRIQLAMQFDDPVYKQRGRSNLDRGEQECQSDRACHSCWAYAANELPRTRFLGVILPGTHFCQGMCSSEYDNPVSTWVASSASIVSAWVYHLPAGG
jgi:hypothetical protein